MAKKPKNQREKFLEAAKNNQCDTGEAAFDMALKRIAKSPKTDPRSKSSPKSKD